jgi:ssRNA-specific RNase YbeY (16S rRNA maturation enzyme)
LLLLTVHGTLHTCGWDHDEPVEEAAMRAMEWRILQSVGGHAELAEPEAASAAGER